MPGTGRASTFLSKLGRDSLARLENHLEPVALTSGDMLIEARKPISHVHFLEGGLATLNCGYGDSAAAVAVIGRHNFSGHALVLGRMETRCNTIMQIAGPAKRIGAQKLLQLAEEDPDLRHALLNSVDDLLQQVAEVALANAQLTVEARLARLLLMATEQLGDPVISLTHDRLALMLGCRRAGVTMSMHLLEGEHAIRATRAKIAVRDLQKLRQMAAFPHHPLVAEPTPVPVRRESRITPT